MIKLAENSSCFHHIALHIDFTFFGCFYLNDYIVPGCPTTNNMNKVTRRKIIKSKTVINYVFFLTIVAVIGKGQESCIFSFDT